MADLSRLRGRATPAAARTPGGRAHSQRCPRHPVHTQASGYSLRWRRAAKPVAAPASSAQGAADVAAHYGQHPPHKGEHAAIETASSRGLMISGTPAPHPAPATRSRLFHGLDDIKGTQTRHDAPFPRPALLRTGPSPGHRPRATYGVTGPPPATALGGPSSRRYGAGIADPDTAAAAGRVSQTGRPSRSARTSWRAGVWRFRPVPPPRVARVSRVAAVGGYRLVLGSRRASADDGRCRPVSRGAWAQLAAVPVNRMAPVPVGVPDVQAAAFPTAGLTALRALEVGGLLLGRRVLVTGAAGGVGRMAVQLARASGADVTALVRDAARSRALLGHLGAAAVVERLGGDFYVIIDGVGGATFGLAIEHLCPRGVLVNIATQDDEEVVSFRAGRFDRARGATIYTLNLPDELAAHASAASDLTRLCTLAARGLLDGQIELECSWRQAGPAIDALLN